MATGYLSRDERATRWTFSRAAPAAEPLSRTEAKVHLRVDSDLTADDTLIDNLIIAAREYVERFTRRILINSVCVLKLDAFPSTDYCEGVIYLRSPPVGTFASITYIDTTGTSQTLSASLYQTDLVMLPARVRPAYGEVWPETRDQMSAVTLNYTSGYGATSASVPGPIKQYVFLMVGNMYKHRESTVTGTIVTELKWAEHLLWPYRVLEAP